jgi:hypothetical protein
MLPKIRATREAGWGTIKAPFSCNSQPRFIGSDSRASIGADGMNSIAW